MAKSHRAGKKNQHGHSRAAYAAIAHTRSTTNSEKRKAKAVLRRAADKAKVLAVPRGTTRRKRRIGMVQKRQAAAVGVLPPVVQHQ
jgi:hypothetical protein